MSVESGVLPGEVIRMNREQIWRDLMALPPAARQMVIEFIAFLRLRYAHLYDQEPSGERESLPALTNEPFIGMWRDRTDMADSDAWVRAVRAREWG